jgi:hypothetical protein
LGECEADKRSRFVIERERFRGDDLHAALLGAGEPAIEVNVVGDARPDSDAARW